MHLIEVDCLNTFHHHPLLDQIESNRKKVCILSGAERGDRRQVRKFKMALRRNNLLFKSRIVTCRALYRTAIFQQSVRYDGSLVVMIFPSVYNSEENAWQKILYKIRDKELNNELAIVPVVFDEDVAVCDMFRIHQPLRLVGGYKYWWPLLKPVFGRAVGDIHSIVIQNLNHDKTFADFKSLLASLKHHLMSADESVQILGCEYAQERLNIHNLLKRNGSNTSMHKMNKYPSDPLHLNQLQSTLHHEDVINETITEPRCSFEIHDTSSVTKLSSTERMITKPLPYGKQTHVYLIHNHDDVTMTKVTLLKRLLSILGYKCMTMRDIPPGQNAIQMARQMPASSTAAIVFDLPLLKYIEDESAKQAYDLHLSRNIKFIPVVVNYAENTRTSTTWKDNILEQPIDMNYHHTLWLDKLCKVLDKPFDFDQGVTVETHQTTHNDTDLTRIKTIIKDMNCILRDLRPPSIRYCLSSIIDDEEITKFFKQTLHLPKDMNCYRSDPLLATQTSESNNASELSSQASSSGSYENVENLSRLNDRTYDRVENSGQYELTATCMLKRFNDVHKRSEFIKSGSIDSLLGHTSHGSDLSGTSDSEDEILLPLVQRDIDRHETVPKYPANPHTFVSGSSFYSSGYYSGSATSHTVSEHENTLWELSDSELGAIQETTFISPEPLHLSDEASTNNSFESVNGPDRDKNCRTKLKEIYGMLCAQCHHGCQAGKIMAGLALVTFFIYTYVVTLDIMATSMGVLTDSKLLEKRTDISENPVTLMMLGILTTMISGSSTFSISVPIALVTSGTFTAKDAIPWVLASNIGTSVHNVVRHILFRRNARLLTDELKRHFAAVTLPDRIYTAAVVWAAMLEFITGTSSKPAAFISDLMENTTSVFGFLVSPLSNSVMQNLCVFRQMNNSIILNEAHVSANKTKYSACIVRAFSIDIEADQVTTIGCVIAVISTIVLRCIFMAVSCLIEKTVGLERSVICLKFPSPGHSFILTMVSQNLTMVNWTYAFRYVEGGGEWRPIKLACVCANIGNTVAVLLAFLFATKNSKYVLEVVISNVLFNCLAALVIIFFLDIWTAYFFDKLITKTWFAPMYTATLLLIPLTLLLIQINGTRTTVFASLVTILSSVTLWTMYALFKTVHKRCCHIINRPIRSARF